MVFTPGPMTMLLMSIGADNGFKKTMHVQLGASTAYLISLIILAIGLISLLKGFPFVLRVIQYIGVCYILCFETMEKFN